MADALQSVAESNVGVSIIMLDDAGLQVGTKCQGLIDSLPMRHLHACSICMPARQRTWPIDYRITDDAPCLDLIHHCLVTSRHAAETALMNTSQRQWSP